MSIDAASPVWKIADHDVWQKIAFHFNHPAWRSNFMPSFLESTLTVVLSAVWPVAILAAILGYGNWWWNIGGAIVLSSVIGAINGELAKRRKAR